MKPHKRSIRDRGSAHKGNVRTGKAFPGPRIGDVLYGDRLRLSAGATREGENLSGEGGGIGSAAIGAGSTTPAPRLVERERTP